MAYVSGTSGDDVLDYAKGVTDSDDTIYGGGGDDTIYGRGGNDTIRGWAGADEIWGGSGYDTASYSDSPYSVTVSLISGLAGGGHAEGDELHSIENLTGSAYGDTLWGDDGVNVLKGNNGNDELKGWGGADIIHGGAHNDTLMGMDGNDTLYGESGFDWLHGGMGADTMWAGNGVVTFAWSSTAETGLTYATMDAVMDFEHLVDTLDVSSIDADVYAGGNQTFTFIGTNAFSGTPGEINYVHSFGDTYIQMQTGTSVDVEGVIRLEGIHTPDASWFDL